MFSDYYSKTLGFVIEGKHIRNFDDAIIRCQKTMDMTYEEACSYLDALRRDADTLVAKHYSLYGT